MRFQGDRQGNVERQAWRAPPKGQTIDDPGIDVFCRSSAAEKAHGGRQTADDADSLFATLGIAGPTLSAARERAARNGTPVERELMACGAIEATSFYEKLAAALNLPFIASIAAGRVIASEHVDSVLARPERLSARIDGRLIHIIAPRAEQMERLARLIARKPGLRERLAVATPAAIRAAVWKCRAEARARETVRALFERNTADSARTVVTGLQGFAFGLVLAGLVVATWFAPAASLLVLHVFLSTSFFCCVALRAAALVTYRRPVLRMPPQDSGGPLPRYTVLVALYDEAAMAPQLIAALRRLQWPRTLIEFKLVCEADDRATIEALQGLRLSPEFEIVEVPPIGPRTKPKALRYALSGVGGDYLAIYDAEDRPHPGQLLEAHAAFQGSKGRLAYLQAPLVITNARGSMWSAVFALEYAGLFRGLLPFLSRWGLPLPLGGTSNHFRMDALRASGAWDPHNVTEDADLGLRLYRQGYRGGVLCRATQETAPTAFGEWVRQRTRWLKGWLQTWLVMMRAPVKLKREMGLRSFLVFQVLIAGMLLSALGHPLLIGFIGWGIFAIVRGGIPEGTPLEGILLGVDVFNILGCYLAFLLLARRAMIPEERRRVGRRWVFVPVYWLALSYAAWRSTVELARKPFYWAKTPHVPQRASARAAGAQAGKRA